MSTPFETNERGQYLVIEPASGMEPDAVSLSFNDVTYELSGYAGREIESHVQPDVLVYDECTVVNQE